MSEETPNQTPDTQEFQVRALRYHHPIEWDIVGDIEAAIRFAENQLWEGTSADQEIWCNGIRVLDHEQTVERMKTNFFADLHRS